MSQEKLSAVEVFSGISNMLLLLASILVGFGVVDLPECWLGRWLDILSITVLPVLIRAALCQP
ncbi:hypothetical protein [Pseudomonas syringae]|uniref:hypothetical protein n=1 Tax=Pseudomonas syringae TaxID=317 RepID=UPI0018E65187|nr:hypothetical protein [Pseudomonas syringae]MBI6771028.1 hypothetical protein [Pseudomonas syringae]MBI6776085.1 hypothetical protein [Pseudomonas syringae]MBI6792376.1 hypothetical protein [Pseudomonas syringae]MBI6802807.1 hypothetical protein [Pseudomonas syringae]